MNFHDILRIFLSLHLGMDDLKNTPPKPGPKPPFTESGTKKKSISLNIPIP